MADENIKPGRYLAKSKGSKQYNVVIEVFGEYPFYKIDGWDFINTRRITSRAQLSEIGEEIKSN